MDDISLQQVPAELAGRALDVEGCDSDGTDASSSAGEDSGSSEEEGSSGSGGTSSEDGASSGFEGGSGGE